MATKQLTNQEESILMEARNAVERLRMQYEEGKQKLREIEETLGVESN